MTGVGVVCLMMAAGEQRIERRTTRAAREPTDGGAGVDRESGGALHDFQVYARSFGWRNPGWAV